MEFNHWAGTTQIVSQYIYVIDEVLRSDRARRISLLDIGHDMAFVGLLAFPYGLLRVPEPFAKRDFLLSWKEEQRDSRIEKDIFVVVGLDGS
jgi:hypothetical protein